MSNPNRRAKKRHQITNIDRNEPSSEIDDITKNCVLASSVIPNDTTKSSSSSNSYIGHVRQAKGTAPTLNSGGMTTKRHRPTWEQREHKIVKLLRLMTAKDDCK